MLRLAESAVYYKGLLTLVEALRSVEATLTVVGDGPLYPALKTAVDRAGLCERVSFFRDAGDPELGDHLRQCDLLVLPPSTTSESFGLSVLEAMAAGKPVVVTDLGTGLDEIVRGADAGRIVPPNDPVALADAINGLLSDVDGRRRLGANGQRAFSRQYTHHRMARMS